MLLLNSPLAHNEVQKDKLGLWFDLLVLIIVGLGFTQQQQSDLPISIQVFNIQVAPRYVIIVGTNGFFDSIYNNEMTSIVVHDVWDCPCEEENVGDNQCVHSYFTHVEMWASGGAQQSTPLSYLFIFTWPLSLRVARISWIFLEHLEV